MSREEESFTLNHFPELVSRIEILESQTNYLHRQVSDLEKSNDVQQKMEVIELAFKDRCQAGIKSVNQLLQAGYTIHSQFPNDSGIIVELVKWGVKQDE